MAHQLLQIKLTETKSANVVAVKKLKNVAELKPVILAQRNNVLIKKQKKMTTAELIDYVPVSFKQERDKAERMLKEHKRHQRKQKIYRVDNKTWLECDAKMPIKEVKNKIKKYKKL